MNNPMSVIVPVFNRPKLIVRALDSIFAQTYRPVRLIVVDNGSTDDTPDAVAEWIATHSSDDFDATLIHEATKGACAARNAGLELVDTEYVLFFDSDDEMRPQLISRAVEALDALKSSPHSSPLRLVYWKGLLRQGGREHSLRFTRRRILRNHIIHAILATTHFAATTELIRRAGGWNDSLPAWNDWELGVRLLLCNPSVASISEILTINHHTRVSITGSNYSSKRGVWERSVAVARQAILSARSSDRSIDVGKALFQLDYKLIILAAHYSAEGRRTGNRQWQRYADDLLADVMSGYAGGGLQCRLRRAALRFAYTYTAGGHRGAATLLSPIL